MGNVRKLLRTIQSRVTETHSYFYQMKKISINLFFLLLVVSCKSQEKQTFQDYLSNYINEKDYLNNGFPSLEFQKNDEITAIFWLNIKHKKYW